MTIRKEAMETGTNSPRSSGSPRAVHITSRVLELAEQFGHTEEEIRAAYADPDDWWDLPYRGGQYDGEMLIKGKLAVVVSADDRIVALTKARVAYKNLEAAQG